MKFADYVSIVADDAEEMREMLRTMEKYVERNRMKMNLEKSKIMLLRKGGRRKKGERWEFKEDELEIMVPRVLVQDVLNL